MSPLFQIITDGTTNALEDFSGNLHQLSSILIEFKTISDTFEIHFTTKTTFTTPFWCKKIYSTSLLIANYDEY